MDTADGSDLEKIKSRRERHKARGINGNGFGESLSERAQKTTTEWAAPQARDHFPPHSPERIASMKAEGHGMRNLNDEATQWRAPSDISKRGGSQPAEKRQAGGHSVNLEDQAEHWPGPQSRDFRSGQTVKSKEELWGAKSPPLEYVATNFHPPSSPDRPIAGGSMSSTDGPNSNQPSVKRKLNPIFVEALMRWPTGLSGFERQEMALTLWSQRMQPFVSALVSQKRAEPNLFDLMEQAA